MVLTDAAALSLTGIKSSPSGEKKKTIIIYSKAQNALKMALPSARKPWKIFFFGCTGI
jgi:hypothetical protein